MAHAMRRLQAPIGDARRSSKLRWRCRRGLLENDLFIERFFERARGDARRRAQAQALSDLMDLPDNDLLDLLLAAASPTARSTGDVESARDAAHAMTQGVS